MEHLLKIKKKPLLLLTNASDKIKGQRLLLREFSNKEICETFLLKSKEDFPSEEEIEFFFCQLLDQKVINSSITTDAENHFLNITAANSGDWGNIEGTYCLFPTEGCFTVLLEYWSDDQLYTDLFIVETLLSKDKINYDSTIPKECLLTSSVPFIRDYYKEA